MVIKKHIILMSHLSIMSLCRPCINMHDDEIEELKDKMPELFVPLHTLAAPSNHIIPIDRLTTVSTFPMAYKQEEDTGLKNGARQPPNTKVKSFTKEDRRAITKQKKLAKKQRTKR